jgi:hypothetical protein
MRGCVTGGADGIPYIGAAELTGLAGAVRHAMLGLGRGDAGRRDQQGGGKQDSGLVHQVFHDHSPVKSSNEKEMVAGSGKHIAGIASALLNLR